jgi:hypothetical protein
MNPALEKLGITNELQASKIISLLEGITEVLAKAIAGDDSPVATRAAAFDVSIDFASASSHCSQIYKALRTPPQPTAH